MAFLEKREASDEEVVSAVKYQMALLAADEAADEGMFVPQLSSFSELTCLTLKEQSLHGLLPQ